MIINDNVSSFLINSAGFFSLVMKVEHTHFNIPWGYFVDFGSVFWFELTSASSAHFLGHSPLIWRNTLKGKSKGIGAGIFYGINTYNRLFILFINCQHFLLF